MKARCGEINVADVNGVVIADSDEVILSVTLQLPMLHQPIIHVIILSNLPGDSGHHLEHSSYVRDLCCNQD